jgi:tripartite-type tricarboxylate transporter receptor subunit TctC
MRAYAVSTPERSPLLPEVPTYTELGYLRLEAIALMGLWIAPNVPAPVQSRLREPALKAMARPQMRERLKEVGFDVGQPRSTEEMSNSLRAEYERAGRMLGAIGFKAE